MNDCLPKYDDNVNQIPLTHSAKSIMLGANCSRRNRMMFRY